MSFADNLRRIREQQGMTQKQLAKLAGCTQQAIYNFEQDKNKPNIITGAKIAEILGTTVEKLLEE